MKKAARPGGFSFSKQKGKFVKLSAGDHVVRANKVTRLKGSAAVRTGASGRGIQFQPDEIVYNANDFNNQSQKLLSRYFF